MRVLHCTYQHWADDARILHKQCRSLAASGVDVHLVAPAPQPPELFGVHFHALSPRHAANKLRQLRRWFDEIDSIIAQLQPDVIHLHDPLLLSLGRRLRQRFDARLVYDAHEDHPRQIRALTHLSLPRRHAQAMVFAHLEKRSPQFIDLFVAATPGIAQRYPADRTVTVRNLPRVDEFKPAPQQPQRPALIYVGGLTRSRGILEMVDAIAGVSQPDAELILTGKFDSPETQHTAQSRPGWSRVDYRGWTDHGRVPQLLHEACAGLVLLHPNTNYIDAWPVKLFEYMAAGLPFIASDFQPWRDMLGNTRCGLFVNPQDIAAITSAMQQLLTSPDDARAMGAAGRELIERALNWESESRTLLAGYERLAAARR